MTTSLRRRLRAGDPAAFRELFDADAEAIYRYAARALGDRTTAEDVLSLTFLEAWRLRERLQSDGESVRPWLFGIATNVLRNTTRAARRHRAALARLPAPEAVPDHSDDVVDRIADDARLAAARRALNHLRPHEREVFLLCVWSGLDYAAAAEALGVPIGTVRSRLARARARLREVTPAIQEPARRYGQLTGDRGYAVRSSQETAR
ncbi:RNA polymerase sigma factor [Hamadaea sp. NPDC050747]|uniref:RNA polymerase sigma factor n=1 Tax=Hamadaea sp. NPDC050747 TaxID=3155789 RepID=UPI0034081877